MKLSSYNLQANLYGFCFSFPFYQLAPVTTTTSRRLLFRTRAQSQKKTTMELRGGTRKKWTRLQLMSNLRYGHGRLQADFDCRGVKRTLWMSMYYACIRTCHFMWTGMALCMHTESVPWHTCITNYQPIKVTGLTAWSNNTDIEPLCANAAHVPV